jgi:hypothetical protein
VTSELRIPIVGANRRTDGNSDKDFFFMHPSDNDTDDVINVVMENRGEQTIVIL